jgi:hypothetical protein
MQSQTLLQISANLLTSSSCPLLYIRANNEPIPKPSLPIDNTTLRILQAIVSPEIVNTDPTATSEPAITTPSPVIAMIILRSHVLYTRNPNAAYRSIYRRNKRLRRLDLGIEISIGLDPETPATSINALVVLIYSILPKPKAKRAIKTVRTNW